LTNTPQPEQESLAPVTPLRAQAGWLSREQALALVLIVSTAIALYLCYRLAHPFLPALAWALALAVVAFPLYAWLLNRCNRPNCAAALAVVLVAVLLIAPTLFVLTRLGQEVAGVVERVQTEASTGRWQTIIERNPRLAPALRWLSAHVDVRGQVGQAVSALTARLPALVTGSLWTAMEMLLVLFFLFYFFRDRHKALQTLRTLVPLSEAETTEVFRRVADTLHATIYGTLVVAMVQGALGGVMFWWLGLPTPLVWGTVMGLLAVVPILGTFVVWIPAAAFLALEGQWGKALILTGWGVIVIALVDNLLYPVLVGQRLRVHTLPIFVSMLGGIALFGASGLILGPLVLALTQALVDVWRRRTTGGRTAEPGVHA
jgi:predicted PurR-regulated permease PerM